MFVDYRRSAWQDQKWYVRRRCRRCAVSNRSAMIASVANGRCGPCCSIAPTGSNATARAGSSNSKSVVVIASQSMTLPLGWLASWVILE